MKRRDRELVAASIRAVLDDAANDAAREHAYAYMRALAEDLATQFAEDNPAFNRARFLDLCGLAEGTES